MSESESDDNNVSPAEDDNLSPVEDDLEIIQEPENVEPVEENNQAESNTNNENQEDGEGNKKEPKVKKVRNPQPKLNAERLRGPRGLSMLGDVFKNVKFKGRGHEEEDLGLLMKNYEYWCHRLFPKLPFDDCLERIERLGNKRIVQTYVSRIRLDLLFDEPNQLVENDEDNDTDRNLESTQNNEFDALLPPVSTQPGGTASGGLTDDQLERIRINREKAQRLRQQLLIRNKEMAKMNNSVTNDRSSDAVSQNSNVSDVLQQVDFTEPMSTESDISVKPVTEAMSIDSTLISSQQSVENMSLGSDTFASQMSVAPDDSQGIPTFNSLESIMSISSSQASVDEQINNQVSASDIVPNNNKSLILSDFDEVDLCAAGDNIEAGQIIQLYRRKEKMDVQLPEGRECLNDDEIGEAPALAGDISESDEYQINCEDNAFSIED